MVAPAPILALVMLAPAQPDEAMRIVEQAVRAKGKPDVKGEVFRKTVGNRQRSINGNAPTTATYSAISDDNQYKFRNELKWVENGQMMNQVVTHDGKQLHILLNGVMVPLTANDRATSDDSDRLQKIQQLRWLTDTNQFRLTLQAEETIDGEACDVVRVNARGQEKVDLSISRKTRLLRKSTTMKMLSTGKRSESVEVFNDYKIFSGVAFPTKVTRTIGDSLVREVNTIEYIEFIPADKAGDLFTKP